MRKDPAGSGAAPVCPHEQRGAVIGLRAGQREEAAPRGRAGVVYAAGAAGRRGRGAGGEHPAHRGCTGQ